MPKGIISKGREFSTFYKTLVFRTPGNVLRIAFSVRRISRIDQAGGKTLLALPKTCMILCL